MNSSAFDSDDDGLGPDLEDSNGIDSKSSKSRPQKVLPTDRIAFEKQLSILRGYAAAAGPEKKAVGNSDVAKIVGIHANSISNCNPFFSDIGLLVREGHKYRPTEAVFDYASSFKWSPDKAGNKLAASFESTWFAASLLPKLSFRSFTKDETVTFLAEDAKASPDYRSQLELILEYLKVSGLILFEGNMVSVVHETPPGLGEIGVRTPLETPDYDGERKQAPRDPNIEEFIIPIPGKPSAKISLPKDLDLDDWNMLKLMLDAYTRRLRKESLDDLELTTTKTAGGKLT